MKLKGKFPPITTFAEDYFLKACEVGVRSYREDTDGQAERVEELTKGLSETRRKQREDRASTRAHEQSSDKQDGSKPNLPSWDVENRILTFGKQIARQVDVKASRLITILNAFQEDRWPSRIDDPLPGGPNPERLRDALGTLNSGLKFIRFEADGTGEGIRWTIANVAEVRPLG